MKTRRLHALARKEAFDRLAMHAKNAADSNGIESSVVDQTPDGLGMHAELIRHLTDADETRRLFVCRRHDPPKLCTSRQRAEGEHLNVWHRARFAPSERRQ